MTKVKYDVDLYCMHNSEGKIIDVSSATIEELQQELCNTMEYIETIEDHLIKLKKLVKGWRAGLQVDQVLED